VTGYACPSCGETMRRRGFARKPQGSVDLDLCHGCQAIWFDQFESAQLTPGAVLDVFREIHEQGGGATRPLADTMRCCACRKVLALTFDMQRNNRITYYRCPDGHGRFTPFFQFLREKNFVRTLTALEVDRLKVHVAQVRCASCGAPVDLAHDAQCSYCRAPISILDAEAVGNTIAELTAEEQRHQHVDPAAAVEALLAGKRFERKMAGFEGHPAWQPSRNTNPVDLVGEALDLLMNHA
jgi:hypothetical protein